VFQKTVSILSISELRKTHVVLEVCLLNIIHVGWMVDCSESTAKDRYTGGPGESTFGESPLKSQELVQDLNLLGSDRHQPRCRSYQRVSFRRWKF